MAQFPKRTEPKQEQNVEPNVEPSTEFTSFEDILNAEPDEIDAPKPIAQGDYEARIEGPPETGFSSQKGTPFIQWNVRLIGVVGNVNHADFQSSLGKYTRITIYMPNGKDDRYKVAAFCDRCGISQGNLQDRVNQTPNCLIGVGIKHEMQGDTLYASVRKTFSVVNT